MEGPDIDKDVLKDFVNVLYFEDVELTENNVLGLVQCCKQFSLQVCNPNLYALRGELMASLGCL